MALKDDDVLPSHQGEMIGDTASAHATPDDDNLRLLWKISHNVVSPDIDLSTKGARGTIRVMSL
jgi:hypothetical protein